MTDAEPGMRLMRVDDDPMVLSPTARALRECGSEVLDFDPPDDALTVAQGHGGVTTEIAA
jgi:hypothetical protein